VNEGVVAGQVPLAVRLVGVAVLAEFLAEENCLLGEVGVVVD